MRTRFNAMPLERGDAGQYCTGACIGSARPLWVKVFTYGSDFIGSVSQDEGSYERDIIR
jgi:hypothetical protein